MYPLETAGLIISELLMLRIVQYLNCIVYPIHLSFHLVLPDEVLVLIFEYIRVEEIMATVCRVSKRWKILCYEYNSLWKTVNLDEWLIDSIPDLPFTTIMAHSRAITYISMRNITISDQSASLLSSLARSKNLIYIDLSGQSKITSIEFLGKNTPKIEYFLAEYCQNVNPSSVIECVKHLDQLKFFSVNGSMFPDTSALVSNMKLGNIFNLGLAGSPITLDLTKYILENFPKLLFLQISCPLSQEADFKALCREYDVSVKLSFTRRQHSIY